MRLHIFGASGSGVTTLGTALSNELHIPYFDSDQYFWEKSDPPFTIRRDPVERNALINEDLKTDHWIFGGSSMNWGNTFPDFDLIIFLWIPSEVRIQRLKKREFDRYGEVIYTSQSAINNLKSLSPGQPIMIQTLVSPTGHWMRMRNGC